MTWYENTMTQTAGALIAQLDTYLITNSNWSVFDASAGTNAKVYRNYDATANSDFYFYVDDNYTLYAKVALWQTWDAGTHTGSGNVQPTTASAKTAYIRKSVGMFAYRVKDLNLIIANCILYQGHYVGQLSRCDTTKNMPLLVTTATTTATYTETDNPLGHGGDSGTYPNVLYGLALNDVLAAEYAATLGGRSPNGRYIRSSDGRYYLSDTLVHGESTMRVFGSFEGVCCLASQSNSLAAMDILWVGAQSWLALTGGSWYCAIEKS